MKGENVPNFRINTSTGTYSNVFQILQDLRLKQYEDQYHSCTMPTDSGKVHCTVPRQYDDQYHSHTVPTDSGKAHCTAPHLYKDQYHSSTLPIDSEKTMITVQPTAQPTTSFRFTTPSTAMTGRTTTKQVNPVHIHPETSHKELLEHCTHVHQPAVQVCKPGELLVLRKVKHPLNGRTSVNRLPLTKQDILSQYSSCFKGRGHFPGDPYKFHLKAEHKPARHAPRKVPIHLEAAFKVEIESLVKQGILEEVKEHTDWVNSYVIVEKDTGNHHSPNRTVKKKLRICLDPRDVNEALEREPYHTRSVDEITAKLQGMTVFTIVDFKKGYWMVVLHPDSRKLTCMALPFGRFQWTQLPMGTVVAQDIF